MSNPGSKDGIAGEAQYIVALAPFPPTAFTEDQHRDKGDGQIASLHFKTVFAMVSAEFVHPRRENR